MRVQRLRTVLALLVLLGIGSAAVPMDADAVVTCLGKPVTLPPGTPTGTAGDDVMAGSAGPDTMQGLGGDDVICGGGGNDVIYGGGGSDTLVGGDGDDRLYGQGRCDDLRGGWGNDVLVPGLGAIDCIDTADGEGGRDRIVLAAVGFYDLSGGAGKDTLDIRKMTYEMTVNLRHHVLSPTAYPATESGVHEIETVLGTPQADDLYGDSQDNDLRGFDGDDLLYGWAGNDKLIGGAGHDQVDGGDGSDVCEGELSWSCND